MSGKESPVAALLAMFPQPGAIDYSGFQGILYQIVSKHPVSTNQHT